MAEAITISNLTDRPEFFDRIADRIWRAWWEPHGVPLAYIVGRMQENLKGHALPRAFVAHAGETFAGTASVIVSDLDERPQYTPWVAAVWVEPQFRSQRIGRVFDPDQRARICPEAYQHTDHRDLVERPGVKLATIGIIFAGFCAVVLDSVTVGVTGLPEKSTCVQA